MNNKDKIMYLEAALKVGWATHQYAYDGPFDYIQHLRSGHDLKFLDELHSVEDIYKKAKDIRHYIEIKELSPVLDPFIGINTKERKDALFYGKFFRILSMSFNLNHKYHNHTSNLSL